MKILFIGNSHTYVNDMPALCAKAFARAGLPCEVAMISHGGWGLEEHAPQQEVRFNILYGNYDVVVLQHRAHPMGEEQLLIEGARQICALIGKTAARPLFYMTWVERSNAQSQAEMARRYRSIAKECNAAVAPAGIAFETVRREHPELNLFAEDGEHASLYGSQLAAFSIFSTLTQKQAAGETPEEELLARAAYEAVLKEGNE